MSALPERSVSFDETTTLKTYFLSPNEKAGTKKKVLAAASHENEPGMILSATPFSWLTVYWGSFE